MKEIVKDLQNDNDNNFRRLENDLQKLLAEINNITAELPPEIHLRQMVLSERMRMVTKILDDLSYKAERLSTRSTTLKEIEGQL